MNAVDKVKTICKERGIPISRLERNCGFSNGYIRGLKEGKFPSDRLAIIADYLAIPISELLDVETDEHYYIDPETRATAEELRTFRAIKKSPLYCVFGDFLNYAGNGNRTRLKIAGSRIIKPF